MHKKEHLYYLIQSLSKSEKRYFKLFCSNLKGAKNYIRLFDAMARQKSYDEAAIRKQFAGEAFIKQLHTTKNYLQQLILKSLRNFHHRLSKDAMLKDMLRNIELLFSKELYELCEPELRRAERQARQYDLFPALLELSSWKRKLLLARSGSNLPALQQLIKEEEAIIEHLQKLHQYWHLTANIFDYTNDTKGLLLQEPVIREASETQALPLSILHYHVLYTYYIINGQGEKGYAALEQLIHLLEATPDRIREDPGPYITALHNQVSYLIRHHRYDEVLAKLHQIRHIPEIYQLKQQQQLAFRLWLRTYNIELEMYRDLKQSDKGIALVGQVVQFLEEHPQLVSEEYQLLFWYQFAHLYFLQGDLTQSLRWTNEILAVRYPTARNDIATYARFLNLMIHYELGNIIILKYMIDSCRRFLKKKKTIPHAEKELLRLFARLCKAPKSELADCFLSFRQICAQPEHAQAIRNLNDYLNVQEWIAKQLDGLGVR